MMISSQGRPEDRQQALQRVSASPEGPRVIAFLAHVRAVLVLGEEVQAWAIQRRIFALTTRRTIVVATTGRLLIFSRRLLAGYDMQDIRWQDLTSAKIRIGLFAADISLGTLDGSDLSSGGRPGGRQVRGLRQVQAEDVYRLCQAHDQAWREKRRIRDLEEMRARAGGFQIGSGASLGSPAASGGLDDPTLRLQRARDMLTKGLITDAEYEAIKAKIISSL